MFGLDLSLDFWRKQPQLTFIVGPVEAMKSPPRAHSPLGYCPYPVRPSLEARFLMQMSDVQSTIVTVSAVDARGNPVAATALGTPAWSVDNPNVLALTPSADGSSCSCAAVGPLGGANLTFTGTLPGDVAVSGTLAFTIVSSAAVTVTLTPATPTP